MNFKMEFIKGKNYIITYEDIEGMALFEGVLLAENVGYRRNAFVFKNNNNEQLIVGNKDILSIELVKWGVYKMEQLIAVYFEHIESGGQSGFKFFDDEEEANKQVVQVKKDIKEYNKEDEYKAVKRLVNYDRKNNRVSFS